MMADDIIKVEFVEIGKGEVVPYLYDKGYTVEVEELDV